MAYPAKSDNSAYKALLADIKAGMPGRLYVFHGEEGYLKAHCLSQLKTLLCQGFEDFNYVFLEGERLTADALTDALYTLPMGERKLVVVRDYKLMAPAGDLKDQLVDMLAEVPDYVCLVFWFDALEFKADKRLNIYKAVEKHGVLVDFPRAPASDLIPWLKRHFHARGKGIETAVCERLLFLCGYDMANLITEVEKIAAGTAGERVAPADVEALASRVLEADVFDLTDCVLAGKLERALSILRDLLDTRQEPVAILAAIIRQWQRLYGTKLAMEAGKTEKYITELCGFRSSYPAKLLMDGARGMSVDFLRRAQAWCLECDTSLKSNLGDDGRTLELLLLRLSGKLA